MRMNTLGGNNGSTFGISYKGMKVVRRKIRLFDYLYYVIKVNDFGH
jgi:hypothetical protein